jgi:phenylalanyl-tRNA synthetase beta chain
MRIPYRWLREYVDFDLSPEALGEALTHRGLEVEEIHPFPQGDGEEFVLDAKITPNRGDCLSLLGIAREVASLAGTKVHYPPVSLQETGGSIRDEVQIRIEAPELAPRYSARLVKGVTVGPSPEWMQARLRAGGMRPINNIVDITNYVMLEMGQPLHAFDFHLLRGGQILVRTAREGEVLVTIDGKARFLQTHHLVIADAEVPVAVAGIMGGEDSEVTEDTRDVLIESAHFQPASIRRTVRELGFDVPSEAAYRFSRRVDPGGTVCAADRAAQLMAELAGGQIQHGVYDVYPRPIEPVTLSLRPERCNRLLGLNLQAEEMAAMLRSLELSVTLQDGLLVVQVPTFRGDLLREVDLIEEVARVYGYDNIPETQPLTVTAQGGLTRIQKLERRVREIFLGAGLTEIQTFSLTSPTALARAGLSEEEIAACIRMKNALSEEYSLLRPTLLPSVLETVAHNVAQRIPDIRVFEMGRIYRDLNRDMGNEAAIAVGRVATGRTATQLPQPAVETRVLAGALIGTAWSATWNLDAATVQADFYEVKGLLEQLLAELRIADYEIGRRQDRAFHPGRCAELRVGGQVCGRFGEIHRDLAARYDIDRRVYAFEVDLDHLLAHASDACRFSPWPIYPPARRDIAMIVSQEIPAARLAEVIRQHAGEFLEELQVFDVYTGQGIPPGHRSIAYALTFRSAQRTLTDEEVDAAMQHLRQALEAECGARIRE